MCFIVFVRRTGHVHNISSLRSPTLLCPGDRTLFSTPYLCPEQALLQYYFDMCTESQGPARFIAVTRTVQVHCSIILLYVKMMHSMNDLNDPSVLVVTDHRTILVLPQPSDGSMIVHIATSEPITTRSSCVLHALSCLGLIERDDFTVLLC